MTDSTLRDVVQHYHQGNAQGITSVCSAHPLVIEAALGFAKKQGKPALIEATCNQVNQEGGYTGMTPLDFRNFVLDIAKDIRFPEEKIILGGDHLGPNPWKHLDGQTAMDKAREMIRAYGQAGFMKLHLDTSMGCAGEPVALSDDITARRASDLAAQVETLNLAQQPYYVIGTEVPVPGGATHDLQELTPTAPEAVAKTIKVHQEAFFERGLESAFNRVIGVVVQPGVEFGHTDVIAFQPPKAHALSTTLQHFPNLVFEAHSTDYQNGAHLSALVDQGFCILKVGPWLTFALRQALYGLDQIADILDGRFPQHRLAQEMENIMLAAPAHWEKYYEGTPEHQYMLRHFSFSDRIRYYWPHPKAQAAVAALLSRLENRPIAAPLLAQYGLGHENSAAPMLARDVILSSIERVLAHYTPQTSP